MSSYIPEAPVERTFRRALQLHRQGQVDAAGQLYAEVLRHSQQHLGALTFSAVAALQSGDAARAAGLCAAAIRIDPAGTGAHVTLINALSQLGRHGEVLDCCDRLLGLDPRFADAWLHRGNALRHLGRLDEALQSYDRALAVRPDYVQAWSNRGNLLSELGRHEAALASFDRALALQPQNAEALCNRGILCSDLGRLDAALRSLDQAIAADPGYANAYFTRGMVRLLRGDLAAGWEDFEWRWTNAHSPTSRERRSFKVPRWTGRESLEGRTILLHAEQGLGDTLQFCRYATLVAERGARVILEVQRAVAAVVAGVSGVAAVVVRGEPLPSFDYFCPLLSLPLAFGTTLETIPARVPYLQCDPDRVRAWRERLGSRCRPRVGLVWSGGLRPDQPDLHAVNRRRNVPLEKFAVLNGIDVEFVSLQKGMPAEGELAAMRAAGWQGPPVTDHTALLADFADTAALVSQLDLVISVDTSTAHLAGALGIPVWLLNRRDTCWRWLLDRADSPWYPTLRLYRQSQDEDWDSVLAAVRTDLAGLVARGG